MVRWFLRDVFGMRYFVEWDILSELWWDMFDIFGEWNQVPPNIRHVNTTACTGQQRRDCVLHLFVHWRVSCEELISECGIQLRVMEHSIINIRSDEYVFTPGFTISCISFQTPLISLSWTMNSLISITLHIWIKDCPHFMLKIMHTLKKKFFLVFWAYFTFFPFMYFRKQTWV